MLNCSARNSNSHIRRQNTSFDSQLLGERLALLLDDAVNEAIEDSNHVLVDKRSTPDQEIIFL